MNVFAVCFYCNIFVIPKPLFGVLPAIGCESVSSRRPIYSAAFKSHKQHCAPTLLLSEEGPGVGGAAVLFGDAVYAQWFLVQEEVYAGVVGV